MTSIIQSLRVTPVFWWNYNSRARVKINQGGTRSSKTYSILEIICLRLIEKKRVATVVGQDGPNLTRGPIRDLQTGILSEPQNAWLNSVMHFNSSSKTFHFKNGSILEFVSYTNEQDAKSGARDIAFFNEANGITWEIYRQVSMRTREEVYIDFNASSPFWAHDNLSRVENAEWFYSNYTHNPFCPPHILEYLDEMKRDDPEYYNVYGLGKTGNMGELVIPKITEVEAFPPVARLKKWGYGLDFGFSSSPSTLIKCGWANEKDLYLDEIFYARGMRSDHIDHEMTANGIERWKSIIGDYADGLACAELRVRGWKVKDAVKGNESVTYGIQLMNQYNIFVTKRSENIIFEQKRYKYKKIKTGELAGKYTNEPIKAFNHTWDASRYWSSINLKPLRKIPFKYDGYAA